MFKKLIVVAAVAFQVLVLSGMILEREYILSSGETIYLRTAPIDPRDIFRGDYVHLDYSFLKVPKDKIRNISTDELKKGQRVYAVLKEESNGVYGFDFLSGLKPAGGIFIAGRINGLPYRSTGGSVNIKYGIEKYFLEQDTGLALEKERGGRNDHQRPMEINIALSESGTAIIKGYRWSPLSMKLTVISQSRGTNTEPNGGQDSEDSPQSPVISIGLRNASQHPVSIVNLADQCMFILNVDSRSSDHSVVSNNGACAGKTLSSNQIITLAPGEEFNTEIDLNLPRWQVFDEKGKTQIGTLAQRLRFRVSYDTLAFSELQKEFPDLWLGHLPSQAFNNRGTID